MWNSLNRNDLYYYKPEKLCLEFEAVSINISGMNDPFFFSSDFGNNFASTDFVG